MWPGACHEYRMPALIQKEAHIMMRKHIPADISPSRKVPIAGTLFPFPFWEIGPSVSHYLLSLHYILHTTSCTPWRHIT